MRQLPTNFRKNRDIFVLRRQAILLQGRLVRCNCSRRISLEKKGGVSCWVTLWFVAKIFTVKFL